jgi:hypothetical protein
MNSCTRCGSFAINPHCYDRIKGADLGLCDVCYWRKRAEASEADAIIADLEAKGLGWDVGNYGRLIEARIWQFPDVLGRYRPATVEPLAAMLRVAIADMERNEAGK